jgi:predicted nucleic acid-binding protein
MPKGLEALFRAAERAETTILAPELLLAEVGQVLLKKWQQNLLSELELEEVTGTILKLPIRYAPHQDLLVPAQQLAMQEKLSVYDALFLALARRQGATLFTADEGLAKVARRLR